MVPYLFFVSIKVDLKAPVWGRSCGWPFLRLCWGLSTSMAVKWSHTRTAYFDNLGTYESIIRTERSLDVYSKLGKQR